MNVGGLQIDHQLKSGRLMERNVARPDPIQDLVDSVCKTLRRFAKIGRICHQPSPVGVVAIRIDGGKTVFSGQLDDQRTICQETAALINDDSINLLLSHLIKYAAGNERHRVREIVEHA